MDAATVACPLEPAPLEPMPLEPMPWSRCPGAGAVKLNCPWHQENGSAWWQRLVAANSAEREWQRLVAANSTERREWQRLVALSTLFSTFQTLS